jgi:two-component sensor histidine kinase
VAISGYVLAVPDDAASTYQAASTVLEPAAITRVRRRVVEQLGAWGCADTEGVALVFSELVTNAVIHAGGALNITVSRDGPRVRIAVHDNGSGWPYLKHGAAIGGRGLHIVAELSERWGAEPTATGKVVWAAVPCSAP